MISGSCQSGTDASGRSADEEAVDQEGGIECTCGLHTRAGSCTLCRNGARLPCGFGGFTLAEFRFEHVYFPRGIRRFSLDVSFYRLVRRIVRVAAIARPNGWLKCPEATTKVACKDVYDWDGEAAVMAVNLPLLVGFLMSGLEVTSPQGLEIQYLYSQWCVLCCVVVKCDWINLFICMTLSLSRS